MDDVDWGQRAELWSRMIETTDRLVVSNAEIQRLTDAISGMDVAKRMVVFAFDRCTTADYKSRSRQ